MKKVIILLTLAISFVMMTLISYMKFQTILYLESNSTNNEYYAADYQFANPEENQRRGH